MRDTLYKAQILCYVNKEQTVFCLLIESNKLEYDKHKRQHDKDISVFTTNQEKEKDS